MRRARKRLATAAIAAAIALTAWAVEPARYSPDAGPHKATRRFNL
jgi:hypothetical protein